LFHALSIPRFGKTANQTFGAMRPHGALDNRLFDLLS
jgi:hypothetical protein